MTPRQKLALKYPCWRVGQNVHGRYARVTGVFTSVLNFDVHKAEAVADEHREHAVDGRVGLWHGVLVRNDGAKLEEWGSDDIAACRLALGRLVKGVGVGEPLVVPGRNGMSIHLFSCATKRELQEALREVTERPVDNAV